MASSKRYRSAITASSADAIIITERSNKRCKQLPRNQTTLPNHKSLMVSSLPNPFSVFGKLLLDPRFLDMIRKISRISRNFSPVQLYNEVELLSKIYFTHKGIARMEPMLRAEQKSTVEVEKEVLLDGGLLLAYLQKSAWLASTISCMASETLLEEAVAQANAAEAAEKARKQRAVTKALSTMMSQSERSIVNPPDNSSILLTSSSLSSHAAQSEDMNDEYEAFAHFSAKSHTLNNPSRSTREITEHEAPWSMSTRASEYVVYEEVKKLGHIIGNAMMIGTHCNSEVVGAVRSFVQYVRPVDDPRTQSYMRIPIRQWLCEVIMTVVQALCHGLLDLGAACAKIQKAMERVIPHPGRLLPPLGPHQGNMSQLSIMYVRAFLEEIREAKEPNLTDLVCIHDFSPQTPRANPQSTLAAILGSITL